MKILGTKNDCGRFAILCRAWLGCLVFAVLHSSPVTAQEPSSPTVRGALPYNLLGLIRSGDSVDKTRTKLLSKFKEADIDGNGVSAADYELKQKLKTAASRARVIRDIFSKDLNGNGIVERKELEAYYGSRARKPIRSEGVMLVPTKEQIEQKLNAMIKKDLDADKNDDGTITVAEVSAWADARESTRKSRPLTRTIPLSMDVNGDGVVSEAEFIGALDRFLKIHDADGDGRISVTEKAEIKRKEKERRNIFYAARRERRRTERLRKLGESCGFPRPAQNAKILLVGTYGGAALSTVSLGSDDVKVTVSDVRIEPGSQPLYILLTSFDAMIWRFNGAVDRVVQVVASSYRRSGKDMPRAGIIGLPAARVFIAPKYDCLHYYGKSKSKRASQAVQMVPHLLDRGADAVIGRAQVSEVSLPAGLFEPTAAYSDAVEILKSKSSAPLWQKMLRRHRGGLVRIDPKAVVSRSPAKAYSILPRYAGLAQLVDRGALRIVDPWKIDFQPDGRRRGHGAATRRWETFLVLKKVRYPAGLDVSVLFVLPPGVEKPRGSPGRSSTRKGKMR